VILECYDEMAEAMKTGRPYQTILDPPPAHPYVAHSFEDTKYQINFNGHGVRR